MRLFVPNQSIKQIVDNAVNDVVNGAVVNNVRNAFNALGIVVGTETQTLDDAIKGGNSLAVKAVIFKGNHQITPNSLNLAIDTKNPDIVESVVGAGAEVNSAHIISSIQDIFNSLDKDEEKKQAKITKNLVDTMRAKKQKIDSEVLMEAIKKDNFGAVNLLINLGIRVTEEHINFSASGGSEYGDAIPNALRDAREKQIVKTNDAEKIKNLSTLGSGAPNRNYGGFFTEMDVPKEIIMKIVSLTGNESKPVTEEEMRDNYYNKPQL